MGGVGAGVPEGVVALQTVVPVQDVQVLDRVGPLPIDRGRCRDYTSDEWTSATNCLKKTLKIFAQYSKFSVNVEPAVDVPVKGLKAIQASLVADQSKK